MLRISRCSVNNASANQLLLPTPPAMFLQVAVIEFARNVLGIKDADSTEFNPGTPNPAVVFMPEISTQHMGGTMRLGARRTVLQSVNCLTAKLYQKERFVDERHRHRSAAVETVVRDSCFGALGLWDTVSQAQISCYVGGREGQLLWGFGVVGYGVCHPAKGWPCLFILASAWHRNSRKHTSHRSGVGWACPPGQPIRSHS